MVKQSKVISIFVMVLLLAFGTACTHTEDENIDIKVKSKKQKEEIVVFHPKIEINDELNRLGDLYEEENPNVMITFKSASLEDYGTALKSAFAGETPPDLFNLIGEQELEIWKDKTIDLSSETWIKQLEEKNKNTSNFKARYTVPLTVEGYGIIYNKDLFETYNIPIPTNFKELKQAFQAFHENNINAISVNYGEVFNLQNHFIQIPLEYQKREQISKDVMLDSFLDFIDLTIQYGDEQLLSIDYLSQIENFTTGKVPMMVQGSWTVPIIERLNPHMNTGMLPIMLQTKEETTGYIGMDVALSFAISKDSHRVEQSKKFLEWLLTSDKAISFLTEEAHALPLFLNSNVTPRSPILKDIETYVTANKAVILWDEYRNTVETNRLAVLLQAYVAGEIGREELKIEMKRYVLSHNNVTSYK